MSLAQQPAATFGAINKRPPFTVEYFNDKVAALPDRESEHRKSQFKVCFFFLCPLASYLNQALTGFESYSEFLADFYRRPATYWVLLQRGPHLPPRELLAPFLKREPTLLTQPHQLHHTKVRLGSLCLRILRPSLDNL